MSDTGDSNANPSRGSRTLMRPPETENRFPAREPKPQFYDCGICGSMHWSEWNGDCREDQARFDVEDLDKRYSSDGWTEVAMPGTEDGEDNTEL
jgi:hypothetical protein